MRKSLSVELKMKIHMLKLKYEKAQAIILERRKQLIDDEKSKSQQEYRK